MRFKLLISGWHFSSFTERVRHESEFRILITHGKSSFLQERNCSKFQKLKYYLCRPILVPNCPRNTFHVFNVFSWYSVSYALKSPEIKVPINLVIFLSPVTQSFTAKDECPSHQWLSEINAPIGYHEVMSLLKDFPLQTIAGCRLGIMFGTGWVSNCHDLMT